MNAKRKRRIKRDWPKVLEDYDHSGLSAREFCQKQGLCLSLFYRHRRELRQMNQRSGTRGQRDHFLELSPVSAAGHALRITFPGPVELVLHNHCDPDLLREAIIWLQRSSC